MDTSLRLGFEPLVTGKYNDTFRLQQRLSLMAAIRTDSKKLVASPTAVSVDNFGDL